MHEKTEVSSRQNCQIDQRLFHGPSIFHASPSSLFLSHVWRYSGNIITSPFLLFLLFPYSTKKRRRSISVCTHKYKHTQTHTHTYPYSKAIEGRSLMEIEVRSSSLLVEIYQWGPIKECLFCMFRKICCYDADSGPCETEDISQKNRNLERNQNFCSPVHRIRYQPLACAFHLLLFCYQKQLKDNFQAHGYIHRTVTDLNEVQH